ncbi:mucolipin-2 isoform X2 [Salmo salar]|uniref:Mucolipin-2 isoform X2 n=1 Tax=Salmo salar TaxID=8030 RepID=A0ABM3C9H7_SALSA|nr:mucolipin-2 isoform X2 [Salmo salar]
MFYLVLLSTMSQGIIKEEILRDDLKYYFMSPCEKYRARRQLPWKLGVQILKIVMITSQLILFGLNNQLVVSYKEENAMTFKNLFLKDYSGVDEEDYSVALYSQQAVYDSLFYVLDQYRQLGRLSVGPISYAEEDGKLLPLVICKEYYKRGNVEPSDEAYDIDAQLEKVCMANDPTNVSQWKAENVSFFNLEFYRLVDIKITFQLKGINLQTVRSHELPDCYVFFVTITFDNQCHSGKIKIFLDIDALSSACKNWKISGTAQKNTHYLLVFDGFVILVCLTSAVLCTRSIVLAVKLLQRFSRFFRENYNHKVCKTDQKEFLNGWYVLVIVSDAMAIVGSILKMEIQAKSLTSYDVCSIFLGTSTLMVWVGVIRYLGYFQKYNVLILTMKTAFPKVIRFCCCAGMIYLGYTFCGWIVLGPYHEKSCPIAATPVRTRERQKSRAMRLPKHDPAKPHCFLTHCLLNPKASRNNVLKHCATSDRVSVHASVPPQELLERDGTRTSWPAKPSPNPDDAGPIVHRIMGLLVTAGYNTAGIEPTCNNCNDFTELQLL